MSEILLIILLSYIAIGGLSSLLGVCYYMGFKTQILGKNPIEIYQDTKLNWFGSLIMYLIFFVAFPVLYIAFAIIKIFRLIYDIVYWLFTLGRK